MTHQKQERQMPVRMTSLPDKKVLEELFEYKDGRLWWKPRALDWFTKEGSWKSWNTKYAGKPCGSIHVVKGRPYRHLNLMGLVIGVRRVIFKLHHGWEPDEVRSLDGSSDNDCIENLVGHTYPEWAEI